MAAFLDPNPKGTFESLLHKNNQVIITELME